MSAIALQEVIASIEETRPPAEICVVQFATPFDHGNPKDWSSLRKWTVTGVLSATGFNRILVSTIMAPALSTIARDLHMTKVESIMALSVYVLATAFGPLLIAPLSEIYGRRWILHITNVWFLIWNIICGFAKTTSLLITARFLAGFGASAVYVLAAGVLGDVWRPEQRGRSLGVYILIPLLAVAAGPIIGAFITENTTWRWMFWSTSILQFFMTVSSIPFLPETHAPTILRRRAQVLQLSAKNRRYQTEEDELDAGVSAWSKLTRSLSRPLRLLVFHPIIQMQACLSGFTYGILYLVLATFSNLWTTQYDESISVSGLHYIAVCLGEVAGSQCGGPFMDAVFRRMRSRTNGIAHPGYRIPVMLPGAILTPIGLFVYGWAAQKHAYWLVVDTGVFILSFGMQIGGMALQAYVIDSYPDHVSSASAATQLLRSLAAFGFPLFAPRMYEDLGYGWGNSTLAFVSILIGIPAPFILWKYGPKLREKVKSSH